MTPLSDDERRAVDPATSAEELVALAASRRVAVRRAVAANVAAPRDAFVLLAVDRNEQVRLAVWMNPAVDAQRAALTASRAAWGTLAWQTHLEEDVALALLEGYRGVREQLAGATGWTSVLEVLKEDDDPVVRAYLARNALIDDADRERLAHDAAWEVRAAVARDDRTPVPLARALVGDPDRRVRSSALERLPLTEAETENLRRVRDVAAMATITYEHPPVSSVWYFAYKFPREVEIYSVTEELAWRSLLEVPSWSAWYDEHRTALQDAQTIFYFEDRTDFSVRAQRNKAGIAVGVPVRDMRAAADLVAHLRTVLVVSMARLAEVLGLPAPPQV